MIQIQNEKTIFKKIKILANLSTMNHFKMIHGTCTSWLAFAFSSGLSGFKIPFVGIPCELSLCITDHIHLNCFTNIIILLNSWKCITWETPPPTWVCQWCVIIYLLEVNLTNKGWTYFDLKSIPFNFGFLFFIWSIALFSLQVCCARRLLKMWAFMVCFCQE